MQFLIDNNPRVVAECMEIYPNLVRGQLRTPGGKQAFCEGVFAIDNGGFTRPMIPEFCLLIERSRDEIEKCLFIAVPDVIGDARRTLEVFVRLQQNYGGWPIALVAQDGIENLDVPWELCDAVFIGGTDAWKDTNAAAAVARAAKCLGKHVHVGRVNEVKRYMHFAKLGADTCDGSGVSRFPREKLAIIANRLHLREDTPLLDLQGEN